MKKLAMAIIFPVMLSACGTSLEAHEFQAAYERCKDHGGVSVIKHQLPKI